MAPGNRTDRATQMRTSLEPSGPVQRIIEFKLPLQYLLSILGGIAVMIVTMYFKGERAAEEIVALRGDIRELRAELKVKDNTQNGLSGALTLLQFRLDTAESDIRVLKQSEAPRKTK